MKVLPVLCATLTVFLTVLLLVSPAQVFSERENRMLSVWKAPTWNTLADGTFFEQLSAACGDQFPFRTQWVTVQSYADRLLGKRECNGILFGKDGYLIPKGDDADSAVAMVNLSALQRWERTVSVPTVRLFVPRAADVLTQKLPAFFRPSEEIAACAEAYGGTDLDLTEAFRNGIAEGQSLWYRTDHHWTVYGAYLAYTMLAPLLDAAPYGEEFFHTETVSETFRGSSHSAVGGVSKSVDSIVLYRYEGDEDFVRIDRSTGDAELGFYQWSALNQKDQYRIFLGGNAGHVSVYSRSEKNRPRLLIVKDSYANCLIPFLALHFDLEILDLRYESSSVTDWILSQSFDKILILQGIDTLGTDSSLGKLAYETIGKGTSEKIKSTSSDVHSRWAAVRWNLDESQRNTLLSECASIRRRKLFSSAVQSEMTPLSDRANDEKKKRSACKLATISSA